MIDPRDYVTYDPATGVFTRKTSAKGGFKAGDETGSLMAHGYVEIAIKGHRYTGHTLAWFIMTGEWPTGVVDHKDLNRSNNRWGNLRHCTQRQNCANQGKRRSNTSGAKGVTASRTPGKWMAQIMVNYKNRYLGTYDTVEAASEAYRKAAEHHFGEFAHD